MNTLARLLNQVVSALQTWPGCVNVRVLETQQFSDVQFALKVRAETHSGATLHVRLYQNRQHIDYAYHLIHEQCSLRWDNKEHFPTLSTYPHHFHTASGEVQASPLTGDPNHDLPLVLRLISKIID